METEAFMAIPVFIDQDNGKFVATLVGSPEVRVSAPTREAALAQMQTVLQERMSQGNLVLLEVAREGIMAIAGKYKDDPFLTEIREEIYRQRDAEPKE